MAKGLHGYMVQSHVIMIQFLQVSDGSGVAVELLLELYIGLCAIDPDPVS